MKIIFLDVDGVLVTWNSLHVWGLSGPTKSRSGGMLDPGPVKILNEIIEKTGANIVISSSWRIGRTLDRLKSDLTEGGVNCSTMVDFTPRRNDAKRGLEIQEWLNHYYFLNKIHPEKMVILDDEISDMDPFKHLVVQSSMETGLTEVHLVRVLEMLNLA
jgi:hypothetical protein